MQVVMETENNKGNNGRRRKINVPGTCLSLQRRLLQMEYEEEKRAFSEVADRIGVLRLTERGDAWYPVTPVRTFHNSLNKRVVELTREADSATDHNFEYGKPVMFFMASESGARTRMLFNGTVSYVDGDRMVIEIQENATIPTGSESEKPGIMLSFDETSYRVMFDALERTAAAKGRLGELRDLIYSRREARELQFAPLRFPYLNPDQEKGVNKVLAAKDVAIVHGPPGTGKTTTLVEAVYETLRRESQVLVCAQSNSAVDLICERLSDRGVNVLRIGNPTRVNDKMLSSTYERRFEAHPEYPTLWSIRKAIREMRSAKKRSDAWHRKMDALKSNATDIEFRINADLFGEARVIASTLVGSAHRLLDGIKVSTLFVDEAAQALEAATWIPVRHADRIILAGDHCQLPPTVKSYEAMRQGLGVSLMERIVENHPEAVVLLGTQYRMHEDIMRFSSEWFYGGGMKAAPEVRHRGILDLDTPIEWIDSSELMTKDDKREKSDLSDLSDRSDNTDTTPSFREALAGQSHGRINTDEALLTLLTLQNYLERIGSQRILDERIDIAVISPYRAQVRYLRQLISRTPFFKSFRNLITINTVDGFQGRESDVVIISLVRSNETGQIGFLRDLRRMNVAMTRARMKLMIIGDAATMGRHPFYRRLHRYIAQLHQD